MDDKIVVNTGQMREQLWIIRNSQNRMWDGPGDFPNNVSALHQESTYTGLFLTFPADIHSSLL